MKKVLFLLLFACLLWQIGGSVSAAEEQRYVLKYRDSNELILISEREKDALLSKGGAQLLGQKREIEYIEPDYEAQLFGKVSNDWSVAMVDARTAWDCGCYGEEIRIGVIDSGVCIHPEFKGRIAEGYNTINRTKNVTDDIGHGTFICSVLCAASGGRCMPGVAPRVTVVPIKSFSKDRNGTVSELAEAISYAVDQAHCDVINMSFGMSEDSKTLGDAVRYAQEKGVILVAAAGNEGATTSHYPASYDGVIGVGAVDRNGECSDFSQRNASVDVTAPGEQLTGLGITGAVIGKGTSFAAPHVAAAAALALCADPTITPARFEELMQTTSVDCGAPGWDRLYGYGVLNIGAMMQAIAEKDGMLLSPISAEKSGFSAVVFNPGEQEKGLCLCIATYREGRFVSVKLSELTLAAGEMRAVNLPITDCTMHLFLCDGVKLTPLTEKRETGK